MKLKQRLGVAGGLTLLTLTGLYTILGGPHPALEHSRYNPWSQTDGVSHNIQRDVVSETEGGPQQGNSLYAHIRRNLNSADSLNNEIAFRIVPQSAELLRIQNLSDSELFRLLARDGLDDMNPRNKQAALTLHRIAHVIENQGTAGRERAPGPLQSTSPTAETERVEDRDVRIIKRLSYLHDFRTFSAELTRVATGRKTSRNVMLDIELELDVIHKLKDIASRMAPAHRKKKRRRGRQLDLFKNRRNGTLPRAWHRFHNEISQHDLYPPTGGAVEAVLRELTQQPVASLVQHPGGTQLKLSLTLADRGRALWKPMRNNREVETRPDHFYFCDFERHNAEIAAFHLDRILDFRRVPPTAGRRLNVTSDLKPLAPRQLLKTFFVSPAGNVCFHGKCEYYCDTSHAVCGAPELLEGSLAAYLPSSNTLPRAPNRHPWRRSYHKRALADWETDDTYCERVRNSPPYDKGRRLLDLMDMAAFDFLTGNMDRHHYETIKLWGNETFPLMLDNGRGFGRWRHDELSILAPLYQCCLFRRSTLQTFLELHTGPTKLSQRMRESMARDPITPILTNNHLTALDRRIKVILQTLFDCVRDAGGHEDVIIDDGF